MIIIGIIITAIITTIIISVIVRVIIGNMSIVISIFVIITIIVIINTYFVVVNVVVALVVVIIIAVIISSSFLFFLLLPFMAEKRKEKETIPQIRSQLTTICSRGVGGSVSKCLTGSDFSSVERTLRFRSIFTSPWPVLRFIGWGYWHWSYLLIS